MTQKKEKYKTVGLRPDLHKRIQTLSSLTGHSISSILEGFVEGGLKRMAEKKVLTIDISNIADGLDKQPTDAGPVSNGYIKTRRYESGISEYAEINDDTDGAPVANISVQAGACPPEYNQVNNITEYIETKSSYDVSGEVVDDIQPSGFEGSEEDSPASDWAAEQRARNPFK